MTSQQTSAPTQVYLPSNSFVLDYTPYVFVQKDSSGSVFIVSVIIFCNPKSDIQVTEQELIEIDGVLCREFGLSGILPPDPDGATGLEAQTITFQYGINHGEQGVLVYAVTDDETGASIIKRKKRGTVSIPDNLVPGPADSCR